MHAASLICACDRFLAWVPQEQFNFISETIRVFGWPTEPVKWRPLYERRRNQDRSFIATATAAATAKETIPMAKASDFFPSNYLRAGDLTGKPRVVTIDRVETGTFENDGKKQTKPVIQFKDNGVKGLVCNKTNFMLIAAIHGDDTDGWSGKRITLYPEMVSFKGQVTESVRVRRAPEPAAPATTTAGQDMNDSIPF
jgi:hypothetical protein